ncbi:receptor-like protein 4 [Impatiens glandulifera]|uniref:receptor-like protein 4 n=1 Tax=Impatiens glandulifera TaxID=253017 RepID=UPI001FB15833|nr:receptor-like protein 4 [Impatiens glandulifera]
MLIRVFSLLLSLLLYPHPSHTKTVPYQLRMSCGARDDVHTRPTNTFWSKDFAYTGGLPANGTRTSFISPPLQTVRYFPLSEGPENCYNINRVPSGHYAVRIFLGLVTDPNFDNEPLFDISLEGTQIYSLKSGWSSRDNEQVFVEGNVFLTDGSASLCFHSTGHGDPAILAIEILQISRRAYNFGPGWGKGSILRTHKRLSCGSKNPRFDVDYRGDHWGGDRFWDSIKTFGQGSDRAISTSSTIKMASSSPNFYPQALYQTALVGTVSQPILAYTVDVDPNRKYSVWLHFAEIDSLITGVGQRVFDVLINGDAAFKDIDIVNITRDINSALVLNKTIDVKGKSLTIALHPSKGTAIINALEIFEIVPAEAKTLPSEVKALQKLKSALSLPPRFGWNGDPCVPQQHPWSGANCRYDRASHKWVIDGLGLDNQGLGGFLPNDLSQLSHLQSINLSGNSIKGPIPSSIGNISTLQILDFSFNFFNGSIPESLGKLTALQRVNLNGNLLSGKVPETLGGRLLHRASFNFTDNAGLCGIPGLRSCGYHLSTAAKVGIAIGSCLAFLLVITCLMCWWKRRQNILKAQKIAARDAPYAKSRTIFNRDVQMGTRHHSHENSIRTANENGPSLLS